MNINIEQVTFSNLSEVAYGVGTFSLYSGNPEKKVTVKFSVENEAVKVNGFVELDEKYYFENVSRLEEIIKEKLIKNL